MSAAATERPQSRRGQRFREQVVLDPIDQIRMTPGGVTGPWAYYLRPDGATIRDALVICPNGGVPDIEDARLRARYGTGSTDFRMKEQAKGHIFLGSKLTPEAVARLVQSMADNREDEILWCQEQIEEAERDVAQSDLPQVRDQARKRKRQLQRRIDTMLAPFDADKLLTELEEIAHAQMLASVDPNVLKVMRAMVGEVNEKLAKAVSRFTAGKQTSSVMTGAGDDALVAEPVRRRGRKPKNAGLEFTGVASIDVDNGAVFDASE